MWSWIWQQRFWMSWRLERIEELQQPNGLVMKAWVTASRCYSENSLTLEVGYEMVEAGLTQQLIDIWVFAQSWPIINNTVLQTMNHWGLSDPPDLLSCHAYFFFFFFFCPGWISTFTVLCRPRFFFFMNVRNAVVPEWLTVLCVRLQTWTNTLVKVGPSYKRLFWRMCLNVQS